MAKLSSNELKGILSAARSSALGSDSASTLSDERTKAQNYYYGDMSDDMPAADGRSSAVSTDVCDTVEGLMPSLMEIFAGGDEVVKFEPVGPEDVAAAEQETDFINHVFLQQNPGFLILYNFIKDALLSKNGFVKVFWEEKDEEERETYLDQSDDAFAMIAQAAQSGEIEIVEHSARDMEGVEPDPTGQMPTPQVHDVTIVTTKKYECAKVEGVPPEEFGIERNARNIRDCNYCFHEVTRSQADLIEQGFDENQIKKLPTYANGGNTEAQARDTVEESPTNKQGDEGVNSATRLIRVTEHYVRMDYERNGKAGLYRVTTGGEESEVLRRDGKPDIEPVDMIPFASMSPIIVPHRFFGRSVADLVMDIQRIKTALLRGVLDNTYMVSNPRVEVGEDGAGPNTLDDLLVSRPGGVVRTKRVGSVQWQVVPSIAEAVYPALEYYDNIREWRTGVTRQGQGIDAKALQNQSATAVNQSFTMAQARMKLIARILAETGIKDLFALLHATIRKHGSKAQTVRLKNKWVQVDPREWKSRSDLTINVGLGSGGKAEQMQMMTMIGAAQEKFIAAGMTNIVQPKNMYNTAKALTKIIGERDPNAFFSDPDEKDEQGNLVNPAPEPQPDPKMLELQAKNEIEKTQAEADMATQKQKTEAELFLAREKATMESQMRREEHEMKMQEHRISMVGKVATHAMKPKPTGEDGQPVEQQGPDLSSLMAMVQSMGGQPKSRGMRVVRDEQGRVSHTEPLD